MPPLPEESKRFVAMSESRPRSESATDPRRVDLVLNIGVTLLILGILALGGYFGYTVYLDKQQAVDSTAPTRVIQALEKQVRVNPNNDVLRVRLGEAYAAAKRYEDAVAQFNAAIQVNPKHSGAYLDLGMVAMITKNDSKAANYFKKVLELTEASEYSNVNQRREMALYNLGVVSLRNKRHADAAGYFKAALRIRKDSSDSYLLLARSLKGMGEAEAAIENAEIALQFDPGYAEAYFFLGQIYTEQKDDVNASYAYYQAVKHAPEADVPRKALESMGKPAGWAEKAQTKLAADDVEGALHDILVATNLAPDNAAYKVLHGDILMALDDKKAALKVYREALELSPTDKALKAKIAELDKKSVKKK